MNISLFAIFRGNIGPEARQNKDIYVLSEAEKEKADQRVEKRVFSVTEAEVKNIFKISVHRNSTIPFVLFLYPCEVLASFDFDQSNLFFNDPRFHAKKYIMNVQ